MFVLVHFHDHFVAQESKPATAADNVADKGEEVGGDHSFEAAFCLDIEEIGVFVDPEGKAGCELLASDELPIIGVVAVDHVHGDDEEPEDVMKPENHQAEGRLDRFPVFCAEVAVHALDLVGSLLGDFKQGR